MITLYEATHNITGLKYFGKTTRYHTVEELQKYYHGSGVYWNNHLKKHGDNVTMKIWYQDENIDAVSRLALMYSETYDIVNSDEYANIIPENGLDGGKPKGQTLCVDTNTNVVMMVDNTVFRESKHLVGICYGKTSWNKGIKCSEETKRKISLGNTGKKHTDEAKKKISNAAKGLKRSDKSKELYRLANIGDKNPMFGKKHSEETKKKMSKSQSGIPKPQKTVICPHCGLSGGQSNMTRYHFENCKKK